VQNEVGNGQVGSVVAPFAPTMETVCYRGSPPKCAVVRRYSREWERNRASMSRRRQLCSATYHSVAEYRYGESPARQQARAEK